MKALTIKIGYVDSAGNFVPWASKPVYLKPSRTDITFLSDGVYLPWNKNQLGDVGFEDCWKAVTNGLGVATFAEVPFTDTEMHRPLDPESGDPIGPEIEWNFINPWGSNGTIIYSGKLLSTMTLGATVNMPDDVMQLATGAWRVSGAAYVATPLGGKVQQGTITFGVGVTQNSANFPIAYTSPPTVWVGQVYDKDGNLAAAGLAQDGSGALLVTNASATVTVPPGLTSTVNIPYLAIGN
jgi:hypothetical protein